MKPDELLAEAGWLVVRKDKPGAVGGTSKIRVYATNDIRAH